MEMGSKDPENLMERPVFYHEREHALSRTEVASFLDGVSRTEKRTQLCPPPLPVLRKEALRTSAEYHGYQAKIDPYSAAISVHERISPEGQQEYFRRTRSFMPWFASIYTNPHWTSERSNKTGVSFEWKMADLLSVTNLPLKQLLILDESLKKEREELERLYDQIKEASGQAQKALKDATWKLQQHVNFKKGEFLKQFQTFLIEEIVGLPLRSISIPSSIPPEERRLLLAVLAVNDPLRGFLDGTFDDCVYRFETESFSGEAACKPALSPSKTGDRVQNVFVSTDPEDIFWYAKEAMEAVTASDAYSSVEYSLKVIKPRRFGSVDLALKSAHDLSLDRYELALHEGETLAIFPIKNERKPGSTSEGLLLQLCVRGPRKIHEYGIIDPHWNLSRDAWLKHSQELKKSNRTK